jgi:hypothetical protein
MRDACQGDCGRHGCSNGRTPFAKIGNKYLSGGTYEEVAKKIKEYGSEGVESEVSG